MADPIKVLEVEFDKQGNVFNASQAEAALKALSEGQATDLLVFVHGWNNDMADARELYQGFFGKLEEMRDKHHRPQLDARKLAGLAVLWPSKRFTDEELIPSGDAASAEPDALDPVLEEQLDQLKEDPARLGQSGRVGAAEAAALDRAKSLVSRLEEDEDAQRQFVKEIRSILPRGGAHAEDGSDKFFSRDAVELLEDLGRPVIAPLPSGQGGGALSVGDDAGTAAGQAAGLRDMFAGIKAGARRLLNFTTYYKMKERAGLVGSTGVAGLLRQVRTRRPQIKLHLVGHSFGGRLVTAAVDALGPQVSVDSLTLLQAAYSHNGLAEKFDGENGGFFRAVMSKKKVRGPLVITHTKNDKAVGIAYPLASRVASDNAAAFGDADDPYGGMGRNGAQHTPTDKNERVLRAAGGRYSLKAGTVYNLNSDDFIRDHNDICKPEVAHITLTAIGTT